MTGQRCTVFVRSDDGSAIMSTGTERRVDSVLAQLGINLDSAIVSIDGYSFGGNSDIAKMPLEFWGIEGKYNIRVRNSELVLN